MRVILKPGGVLLILGALVALTMLFVFRNGKRGTEIPGNDTVAVKSVGTAPGKTASLLANGDFLESPAVGWNYSNAFPIAVKGSVPDGSAQYLCLPFVPKDDKAWSTLMSQKINAPFKAGERIEFRGWFRSRESLKLSAYVETVTSPHKKMVSGHFVLTPDWKEYSAVGTVKENHAAGEIQFDIHFGVVPGTVEMADFRLKSLGVTASPTPLETVKTLKTETSVP